MLPAGFSFLIIDGLMKNGSMIISPSRRVNFFQEIEMICKCIYLPLECTLSFHMDQGNTWDVFSFYHK